MKSSKGFSLLIAAVLLCFAFFLAWHLVSDAALRFNLADTELMLETSYGRERKQNKESLCVTRTIRCRAAII